jgi:hypothetical protein
MIGQRHLNHSLTDRKTAAASSEAGGDAGTLGVTVERSAERGGASCRMRARRAIVVHIDSSPRV